VLPLIVILSIAVTPLFRANLNRQFLAGARNTAFVTEYVSGMATVHQARAAHGAGGTQRLR